MLSLAPLKRLTLSAHVVTSEPRPQPSCTEPLPARAEEEPSVVTTAEEPSTPPPPVPVATVEEGQGSAEMTTLQVALGPPVQVGPGGTDVVVVLDEDSAPPPPAGDHDVVMTSVPEPAPWRGRQSLLRR
jgi:hypothetical protein